MRSASESSAPPRPIARAGAAHRPAARLLFAPTAARSTTKSTCWSGAWRGAVWWSTGSDIPATTRTRSSSNRKLADYWPRTPKLGNAETLVLSRFAYLRRRGNEMVLESPRAGALFRICDPKVAAAIATLSTPQQIGRLRRQDGFPGMLLLALLVDCGISFSNRAPAAAKAPRHRGRRQSRAVGLSRSAVPHPQHRGPAGQPDGRTLPLCRRDTPPPAVRPRWPGKQIDLRKLSAASAETHLADRQTAARTPFDARLRRRAADHAGRAVAVSRQHRARPAEMEKPSSTLAAATARWSTTPRGPIQSAGSAYELELYLTVANCEGLARGFYHYDADRHALVPIGVRPQEFEAHADVGRICHGCGRARRRS